MADFPVPLQVYDAILGNYYILWLLMKNVQPQLAAAFGVSAELQAGMAADERAELSEAFWAMWPVSPRKDGMATDPAAFSEADRYPVEQTSAPTLLIYAAGDTVAPKAWGEYNAVQIPGAKLVVLDSGGHFMAGQHGRVREEMARFLGGMSW